MLKTCRPVIWDGLLDPRCYGWGRELLGMLAVPLQGHGLSRYHEHRGAHRPA